MKRSKEKGAALVFALIFVLVLSVMGASLMFLSQSETWSSMNYREMTQSRYGAETGMNVAANYIMTSYTPPAGPFGCSGTYNTCVSPVTYNGQPVVISSDPTKASNYPDGTVITAFQNAMTNLGSLQTGNNNVNYYAYAKLLSMGSLNSYGAPVTVQMWQVVARGTQNSVRKSNEEVTAIMERQAMPANVYAAFAVGNGCGALAFSGGGSTNSYNSQTLTLVNGVATPPATFNTFGGNVGANGNLVENGAPTVIYGTMSTPRTGVGNCAGGNVSAWTDNGNATVTGGLVQLPQIVTFPTPLIPAPGSTNENIGSAVTLPPGNYGDISLTGQGVLTLTPGVYNINSISESGNNTAIIIAPDPNTGLYGPVTLNVAGNNNSNPISLSGNSIQNPTLNPADLLINYAGTGSVSLTGGSAAAAVLYAPNASVSIKGGSNWYGAIIGQTVDNAGGVAIHFDLNLLNKTYTVTNYMMDSFTWNKF